MALSQIPSDNTGPYKGRFRITAYPQDGGGNRIYPITLAELKDQLGIAQANVSEDAFLNRLIASATDQAQRFMGRLVLTHSVEYYVDVLYGSSGQTRIGVGSIIALNDIPDVELFKLPFQAMIDVFVIDELYNETEIVADDYELDLVDQNMWARWTLRRGVALGPNLRDLNALRFRYKVGYADTEAELADTEAAGIKDGILAWAAYLYNNRGDCGSVSSRDMVASTAKGLLAGYRVRRV